MRVPDIIQLAVAGVLKFNFIETTITASASGTLSSQKGTGQSEAHEGRFRYTFHPRTTLQPAWVNPGGYLDADAQHDGVTFSVKGTERGGAQWFTKVSTLRQRSNVPGNVVIESEVEEWWCTDARAVSSSFVRAIVPGTRLCPLDGTKSGSAGSAMLNVENITVEFRDYDRYTEILAQSSTRALPAGFADCAVSALGTVIGSQLQLVYKEEHVASERRMCVRSLASAPTTIPATSGGGATGFWNRYREQLVMQLHSSAA